MNPLELNRQQIIAILFTLFMVVSSVAYVVSVV